VDGKVAVILGAGLGLGAAIARRFDREGFAIGLMARRKESLSAVQEEIEGASGTTLAVETDATDAGSVAQAFDRVRDELGDPEVFVYNAGAFQMGSILELTPEQFDDCFRVNCSGAFHGAQQVLPGMLEKGHGTIIFTGRRPPCEARPTSRRSRLASSGSRRSPSPWPASSGLR
jgi:NADP-dependent 3-hydroxy acid dehydrogenase YdfG